MLCCVLIDAIFSFGKMANSLHVLLSLFSVSDRIYKVIKTPVAYKPPRQAQIYFAEFTGSY